MRGQFYSIMIALFIVPILALIVFYSQVTAPQDIATNIRADELKYFSESIQEDLSRFLQINGKRALIAATSLIINGTNKTGLDDAQLRLTEAIENGTLYGSKIFADQKNLSEWEQNISVIGLESGFDVNLSILSFNVTQNDSFSVLFNTTIFINISDATAGMGVSKNMSVAEAVSIEDIQDPIYQIKTNGTVFRTIKKSPLNKIANPSTNLGNLTLDISNRYYHNSLNGASFLDRLEGKFILSSKYNTSLCSATGCGLESFVYLPEFVNPNPSLSDLDYQYWTNKIGCSLNGNPINNWFKINASAADDYGIINLLNYTSNTTGPC